MSRNTMPVSSEFEDIDDDLASDSDVSEEFVEQNADWPQELRGLNLKFIVAADGSIAPVAPLARCPSPGLSDEDSETELARAALARPVKPLIAGGSGAGRGRAGGRGGGPSGNVNARGIARSRGEAIVERLATDEDLPAPLREDIERMTSERNRRARAVRERSAANLIVEGDDSDGTNEEEGGDAYENDEAFVWTPMAEWNGVKETFLPETAGPTRAYENVYDAFRSFWDDSLLSHIVEETNRHAREVRNERLQRDWFDTNLDELLVLFAFWIMLSIIKMPTIKSCFTKVSILRTEIFQSMFSEDRYWHMNRAFHLANGSRDVNDPDNVLYAMGPVIDQLNLKFQQNYKLHQDICINESLTLWEAPVGCQQYLKLGGRWYGIKMYEICESSTGYLWSIYIDISRKTHTNKLSSSVATVVRLMQPLLNLGHVLYMNNWFNCPMLARYLKRRRTDFVGTLRSCRYMPAVIQRAPLAEGEFVARQSGDVMVVALQDRKRLTYMSTFHGVTQVHKEAIPGEPAEFKLQLIEDYNLGTGGVDRLNQSLAPHWVERKQHPVWTKKVFKRLLNITVENARVLLEKSSNTSVYSLLFRLALVESILDRHLGNCPLRNPRNAAPHQLNTHAQFPAERLTERHFIRRIPITPEMRATVRHRSNLGRGQCVWCTAKGREGSRTAYECPQCKVALCLDTCFEEFHTVP